jgi:hypothetical protein
VANGAWVPAIGDRVVLVATGETGTVMRLAPTEWGLLCDIAFDAPRSGRPARRVHASTELQPTDP